MGFEVSICSIVPSGHSASRPLLAVTEHYAEDRFVGNLGHSDVSIAAFRLQERKD